MQSLRFSLIKNQEAGADTDKRARGNTAPKSLAVPLEKNEKVDVSRPGYRKIFEIVACAGILESLVDFDSEFGYIYNS